MGKEFSYGGKLDGRRVTYDLNGKSLLAVDSYVNGKKVFPTKYFKQIDTTVKIFSNGKREPFARSDSARQAAMQEFWPSIIQIAIKMNLRSM